MADLRATQMRAQGWICSQAENAAITELISAPLALENVAAKITWPRWVNKGVCQVSQQNFSKQWLCTPQEKEDKICFGSSFLYI